MRAVSFLILILYFQITCSQEGTVEYRAILNDEILSDSIKENKFNDLLKHHFKTKNFDSLFIDTYRLTIWYNGKKEYKKAISVNKRNLVLMDSVGYKNEAFYRKNLYSLAVYYRKNDDWDNAIRYYDEVLAYSIYDELAVYSSYRSGIYFVQIADYYLAIDYLKNTRHLGNKTGNIGFATDAVNYLAVCYKLINTDESFIEAKKIIENQIEIEKSYFNDTPKETYNFALAALHKSMANNYADKKKSDFFMAKLNYEKALSYARKLKGPDKMELITNIYHDIGDLYANQNDLKALSYFKKALANKNDKLLRNQLHQNKANLYKRLFKFEKAKTNIQSALRIFSPNLSVDYNSSNSPRDFLDSENIYLTITSLINKAEIFIAEANFDTSNPQKLYMKALEVLEVAEEVLETTRLENIEFKTKLFWRRKGSRLYTNAVKVCKALQDYEKAFYFMEKNKALLLLEDVLLKGQKAMVDIPEEITQAHLKLQEDIIKYESTEDSLFRQKLVAKAKYNSFIESLDARYKLYFKSIKPAEVITLDSFQNSITDYNEAYLQYILGEVEGFGMIISKKNVEMFPISTVDSLRNMVKDYKSLLNAPIIRKKDKKKYNTLSYGIYNYLFPEQIRNKLANKSLTIIPDDMLLGVPFEALQTSEKDDDYLIHKNQISYANSITFLSQHKKTKREQPKNAVGFAPVNFSNGLPTLTNSRSELAQLDLFNNTDLFIEGSASKKNLFTNINGYKIVHISTHATINKFKEPHLALSDSLISVSEMYLTNNNANLVVLSACETANGELYKGEGVLSLSRSFFNTGAKSVASTLWSIDDKVTSEIMASFYTYLNDGLPKSTALHKAKLDYINTNDLSDSSPYYWASFILVGDTSPIDFNQDYTLFYVIGSLIVIILILVCFRKKLLV